MEYIHIRNLEKFHPGYKDRTLQWGKIYFKMVQGNPDCDLIENEIDWGRLIKLILLELEAQQPLPNIDRYWVKKGFDIKKRPMSLTIKMLHNFITLSTTLQKESYVDKEKDKDKEKSKSRDVYNRVFEQLWNTYPNRIGKKEAERHFNASVKTPQDVDAIKKALQNYLNSERVHKGYAQNGSTWFNNWRDWIDYTEDICSKCKGRGKYTSSTGYEVICDCPKGLAVKK